MSSSPTQTVQNRITRYSTVHNIKLGIIQRFLAMTDDDGGGEEPLIQDPDLDSLVRLVTPELLDKSPDPGTTPCPPESARPDPGTTPAPPEEPDTTLQEETPHTVLI